jgi:hypothetical protein
MEAIKHAGSSLPRFLTSAKYAADYNEAKSRGAMNSTTR